MTSRAYTQHEREQLIAAWLDIGRNDFSDRLLEMTDADVAEWNSRPVAGYVSEIFKPDDEVNGQVLYQHLLLVGDGELHAAVKAFGRDPLEPEPVAPGDGPVSGPVL